MSLRKYAAVLAILPALALADSAYRLDLGAEVHGNNLRVEPTVIGPADKQLRYEMKVRRGGDGRSSNSSQSGTVKLDPQGRGHLASSSVSVSPSDHYEISVRLYDAGQLVAEQSASYP
jgi:hypothetical protein